jgi:hypothetical protein
MPKTDKPNILVIWDCRQVRGDPEGLSPRPEARKLHDRRCLDSDERSRRERRALTGKA